jgi:hypothetical protein
MSILRHFGLIFDYILKTQTQTQKLKNFDTQTQKLKNFDTQTQKSKPKYSRNF